MTVGQLIRKERKRRGLTQKALGEACGIAEPTIRRYELEKLNPKRETIEKIALALGVSHFQLIPSGLPDCDSVFDEIFDRSELALICSEASRIAYENALTTFEDEAEKTASLRNFGIVAKTFFSMNVDGQYKITGLVQRLVKNPKYQKGYAPQDDIESIIKKYSSEEQQKEDNTTP